MAAPEPPGYASPGQTIEGIPAGVDLATPGRRLGQYFLEGLLVVFTLVIGWIIWSLIVWKDGQTPAMKLLNLRAVKADTGKPATWGTMFLREFVGKGLVTLVLSIIPILPLVLLFMLLWDKKRQQLWDKIAGTIVVNVPATA